MLLFCYILHINFSIFLKLLFSSFFSYLLYKCFVFKLCLLFVLFCDKWPITDHLHYLFHTQETYCFCRSFQPTEVWKSVTRKYIGNTTDMPISVFPLHLLKGLVLSWLTLNACEVLLLF